MGAREYVLSAIVKVLDKATNPLKTIGKGFGVLSVNLDKTSSRLDNAAKKMNAWGGKVSGIGKELTTGLTLPLLAASGLGLKLFGDYQTIMTDFETLMGGNREAAEKFTAALDNFGDNSGYSLQALSRSAQGMIRYGISTEKTTELLAKFGDIARGSDERMEAMSNGWARMQAEGKLTQKSFMSMMQAGFNPLLIVSQKTGISMERLKEMMQADGIAAKVVEKAFEDATAAGGMFNKGAERSNKTLPVLAKMLQGAGEESMRTFGEILNKSLDLTNNIPKLVAWMTKTTEKIKDWTEKNPKLTSALVKVLGVMALLGPAIFAVGKAAKTLSALTTGMSAITKGISMITGSFGAMADGAERAEGATGRMGKFNFAKVAAGIGLAAAAFELWSNRAKLAESATEALVTKITGDEKKGGKLGKMMGAAAGAADWQALIGVRDPEMMKRMIEATRQAEKEYNKSQTEITVKVEAEEGTTAAVTNVKSKGAAKPKVTNAAAVGPTMGVGN